MAKFHSKDLQEYRYTGCLKNIEYFESGDTYQKKEKKSKNMDLETHTFWVILRKTLRPFMTLVNVTSVHVNVSLCPVFRPLDFCLSGAFRYYFIQYITVNDVQTLQDPAFMNAGSYSTTIWCCLFKKVCDSLRRKAERCIIMDECHIHHL